LGTVEVEVKPVTRGEARNADPEGQSERPKKIIQSGVMDVDGRLRLEVHLQALAKT
jgi:hypothetical protein